MSDCMDGYDIPGDRRWECPDEDRPRQFTVVLTRQVEQTVSVTVDAVDEDEAQEIARQIEATNRLEWDISGEDTAQVLEVIAEERRVA